MKKLIPVITCVFIVCFMQTNLSAQQTGKPRSLFVVTDQKGFSNQPRIATVLKSLQVKADLSVLQGSEKRIITIPDFDNKTISVMLQEKTTMGQHGVIWKGMINDQTGSTVVLSIVGEVVTGNITFRNLKHYQIQYLSGGLHAINQIDQSKFKNEKQPIKPELKPGQPLHDGCSTDQGNIIDVMVVYTAAARTGAGGTAAMESTINLAVAEANQAYQNSQITQRLRLVHTEEVNYTESGDISTDLDRLHNGSDGFMDNVPGLRNTYAADEVSLITENGGGYCGLGYMMSNVSISFAEYAYCVVARDCATGYFSFVHELGHNMGADHDCVNANSAGPFSFNRDWINTSPSSHVTPWRTIMSYPTQPVATTRIQYFSNPGIKYGNDPMGGTCVGSTSLSTDNHQVLNKTAATVAGFRCSSAALKDKRQIRAGKR